MTQNNKKLIKNLPLASGVEFLTCDFDTSLFALNKPEGVKSHPNKPGIDRNSLLLAPYDLDKECYLVELPDSQILPVYLLNRLDSPTSGVILLCLDRELASEIHNLFRDHKISKTYFAIAKGSSRLLHGTWKDRLFSEKRQEKVRTQKGGERMAETKFKSLAYNKSLDISLFQLNPITGLTHQLRVQGALNKHPVLGDKTYGDFTFNKDIQKQTSLKRLFLHSSEINLTYNYQGKEYVFKAHAPTPSEFDTIVNFKGFISPREIPKKQTRIVRKKKR